MDAIDEACERAHALIDAGAPRLEILTCLVSAAEIVAAPGAVSSILVLDDKGLPVAQRRLAESAVGLPGRNRSAGTEP
jgi:hypothetical protein